MTRTTFDHLPSELVYKIIDYLTTIDTWCAFYDLNPRLNHLLQSHRTTIDLSHCRKCQFDFARKYMLPSLQKPFGIKFSPRTIVKFTDQLFSKLKSSNVKGLLQSLTLTDMTDESMDIVVQYLNYFVNLRSLTITREREKSIGKFIAKIMSIKMPSLTYLKLGYTGRLSSLSFEENHLDRLRLAIPNIQELILQVPITLSVFQQFISILPQLICIDVILMDRSVGEDIGKSYHSKHASPLQKLIVTMNGIIRFKTMTKLLRDLPRLCTLWFSAFICDSTAGAEYHDGHAWKELIRTHLPHLTDFRLNIGLEAAELASPADVIQSFSSRFWTEEKQWCFVADRPDNDVDSIELYSLPPPAQGKIIFRPNVEWSSNTKDPSFRSVKTLGLLPISERSTSITAQNRVFTNVTTLRPASSNSFDRNYDVSIISEYVDLTKVENCIISKSELIAALPAMSHIVSLTIQCYDGDVKYFETITSPIITLRKLIVSRFMRCYFCNHNDLTIITGLFPNLEYMEIGINELESLSILMGGLSRLIYVVIYNDPEMIDEKQLKKWLAHNETVMKFTWSLEDRRLDIWFD